MRVNREIFHVGFSLILAEAEKIIFSVADENVLFFRNKISTEDD